MQQRVQIFHRRDTPSSATQLPIMTALHAEDLTLFVPILQDMDSNVKPHFFPFGIFVPIVQYIFPRCRFRQCTIISGRKNSC